MIPSYLVGRPYATPPTQTTQIGYAVTCEDCGADVIEYQTAHALQGIGEVGTFRNSYQREPHTCTRCKRTDRGRCYAGDCEECGLPALGSDGIHH